MAAPPPERVVPKGAISGAPLDGRSACALHFGDEPLGHGLDLSARDVESFLGRTASPGRAGPPHDCRRTKASRPAGASRLRSKTGFRSKETGPGGGGLA